MARRCLLVGALCLALGIALAPASLAQGVKPEQATAAQKESARAAFTAGMEAYNDKRFEEALAAFQKSYGEVASPNSHLMVARTLRSVGRVAEAYDEFQAVIDEAEAAAKDDKKYQQSADAAHADLTALEEEIGRVKVVGGDKVARDVELSVGGQVVEHKRWSRPVPVKPGTVIVQLEGQPPKEVEVTAGATVEVDITPTRPKASEKPEPVKTKYEGPDRMTVGFIVGGVGVAGLVVYTVFGALALATYEDIDDQCFDKRCPDRLSEDADKGRVYTGLANAGFAIGIIGLAVGAGFIAWAILDEEPEKTEGSRPRPEIAVGPGSVHLKVTY